MTLHIGFTGTRQGLSVLQGDALAGLLEALRMGTNERMLMTRSGMIWLHHGDCIGADKEAHELAVALGMKTWGHPPTKSSHRAFCRFDYIEPEHPYLERNRHIVDGVDVMVACPRTVSPGSDRRGGTWYTWNYAIDKVPTYLIPPSGQLRFIDPTSKENPHR